MHPFLRNRFGQSPRPSEALGPVVAAAVGAAVGAEQLAGTSHEYVITAAPALNLRAVAKARTNQHSKIYAPPPPPPRTHARTHARMLDAHGQRPRACAAVLKSSTRA